MNASDRDPVVARAISRLTVPDHGPDFWARLDAALAEPTTSTPADGQSTVVDLRPADPVRRRQRIIAVAAAVLVLATTAAVVVRLQSRGTVVPTGPGRTTITAPTTAPSEEAQLVLRWVDALGAGNVAAAATMLGPRSEAYAIETAGSVEEMLRPATEGWGAWSASPDRRTQTITLPDGNKVVLLSGTVQQEGTEAFRADTFPIARAESVDALFIEPWAFGDGSTDARIEFEDRPAGAPLVAFVPMNTDAASGALDGSTAAAAVLAVGDRGRVTFDLPRPLASGRHIWVVAATRDDGMFVAASLIFNADARP